MAPPSFVRINEIVSVQRPNQTNDTSSSDGISASQISRDRKTGSPGIILFLSWAGANDRHIERYTKLYNEIYPSSNIVLVESDMVAFFCRSVQMQQKLVEPVVKMLREAANDTLYVHVMSNAGAQQWVTINKMLFHSEGRSLSELSTIIDSAPGRSGLKQTWEAISPALPRAVLPRTILGFVLGIVLRVLYITKILWPGFDPLETIRKQLNEHVPAAAGPRRCYIYSETDLLVEGDDVVDHAKEAKQKGWSVELVRFEGSPHVGHLKQDPEKYREAIERTWLERSKL
ncbi:hypothetical protein MY11210_005414 [Beauveria gryllotalpidicola]